jgi:quercetin dioxygenase-like cupin family protein
MMLRDRLSRQDASRILESDGVPANDKEDSVPTHTPKASVNPAGETIPVGRTRIRFLVTGADSNGSAAIFELTVSAGAGLPAPPHSHDAYEESVYGLEGVVTFTVDGETVDVGPGDALCIRRGAVHAFANHGDVDARLVATISPGVLGPEYFREAAAVIDAAAGGPPDRAQMGEVMRRHGLTPVPPPGPS